MMAIVGIIGGLILFGGLTAALGSSFGTLELLLLTVLLVGALLGIVALIKQHRAKA